MGRPLPVKPPSVISNTGPFQPSERHEQESASKVVPDSDLASTKTRGELSATPDHHEASCVRTDMYELELRLRLKVAVLKNSRKWTLCTLLIIHHDSRVRCTHLGLRQRNTQSLRLCKRSTMLSLLCKYHTLLGASVCRWLDLLVHAGTQDVGVALV